MSDSGRFVWYDLMTNDPGAARAFYTELLGWSTEDYPMGEHSYTMFKTSDVTFGGIQNLEGAPMPDHWIGYMAVEDVDAGCERIREAGGQVCVPPMDIPSVGRFAVCNDPQGALFSPFAGAGDEGMRPRDPSPPVGMFCWNELMTTDPVGAIGFYKAAFGVSEGEGFEMGGGVKYRMIKAGEAALGVMPMPPGVPAEVRPQWIHYVHVQDVDATAERAKEMGAQVLFGPFDISGGHGRVATLADPRGGIFALWKGQA